MPIVQISMIQGRTPEKKEQLIKKVTEAIIEVLKVPADRVRIVLNEVPKENLGYGGVPLSKIDFLIGMMEYWSNGVLGVRQDLLFPQYSTYPIIPLFHFSQSF